MNPLRTFIDTTKNTKLDFWVERVVLHHLMEVNNLTSCKFPKACFLSLYHRPIEVIEGGEVHSKEYAAGTLIAWSKGVPIQQGHHEQQWENSYIIFGGPSADEFLSSFPCNQALEIKDQTAVYSSYETIYKELTEFDPVDMRVIRNMIENLLRTVARGADTKNEGNYIPKKYLLAKRFIANNYSSAIQIPQLAEMTDVSVAYFSKQFKRYFSCSPIEYLITIRMEQAAYLMRDPNLSITDIATMVGFENIYYFSKVVKDHHGKSPRALRKELWST